MKKLRKLQQREPVLVVLTGLTGVLELGLVAADAIGLVTLDAGQIAKVGAAVGGACALAAATLRARVDSPATVRRKVAKARRG